MMSLMTSLSDHKVYQVECGRFFGEDDKPVPDVIVVGLQHLTDPDGSKNPLTEYNTAFKRLQRRRRMAPVSSTPTATVTTVPSTTRSSEAAPQASNSHISAAVPRRDVSMSPPMRNDPIDSPVGEEIDEPEEEDGQGELTQLLDDLEHGVLEPTLARLSAADVAFDMDEVEVEDEDDISEESEVESDNEEGGGA